MTISLRPYQNEAVESVFDFYSKPRELDAAGKPKRKNALLCLPTGTGKSLIIGELARRMFERVPNTRLVMSTHVKELIRNNAEKLQDIWPMAPLGIYSAGLKSADSGMPIVFGGIQSMVGKYPKFGSRDFLFIDEAHLVGNEGSYLKFINELEQTNPFLKIVGLSATPYRLGMGCLTNGQLFTDIIYDITDQKGFQKLIADGYLCPLISKPGNLQIDTSNVGLDSKGEFVAGEIHKAIKEQAKTREQLTEFVAYGENRKSWIVFAAGIEEAEEINDLLNNVFGISSVVLHSKMPTAHNDGALKAWKNGDVRCAVNMNMLTTGVDNPMLDYCGDFQPTTSTAKHVQKNGRLTRPFPGKPNGLVMDYAGNFRRLGPIDDPLIPKMRGKGPAGDAPIKICRKEEGGCGFYNHASARYCGGKPYPSNEGCGREFVFQDKTTFQAFSGDAMRSDAPLIDAIKVDRVIYTAHVSKAVKAANPGALHSTLPISIKVSYYCGLRTYYEWVTVEGLGGRVRGRDWFRQRFAGEPPSTNTEVLALASQLRKPETIKVWMNANPQPKVMSAEF
jgi:DNA repair protein RadD